MSPDLIDQAAIALATATGDDWINLRPDTREDYRRDAAAILEATVPLIRADERRRALEDVARRFQMGGWTILTAPPPAGAIPSIALGQRVTDWLREQAAQQREEQDCG